ncbi:MAG: hypothetical protein OEZ20_03340 [candidate division WOR-3 bacterium]|nr:hypothetical protein [candidate division WOR-3 bacterium]MDH5683480.1 hypothetical protein [candidate division WOR-3 bacterium]
MKYITIEKIWKSFDNKYEAVIKASREARRVIEAIEKNEINLEENPYRYAIKRVVEEKTKATENKEEG